jgi:hypothetical protein
MCLKIDVMERVKKFGILRQSKQDPLCDMSTLLYECEIARECVTLHTVTGAAK